MRYTNISQRVVSRNKKKLIIGADQKINMTEPDQTQFLLRIPAQLKADLQREAAVQGRKLTQEINIRLRESLKSTRGSGIAPVPANYSTEHTSNGGPLKQESPAYVVTDLDQAMLAIFHAMPVEKQLALLSLFK